MNTIISIDRVSAAYGGKTVLNDISLNVFDHDYLGIIGPNGGGKTTLMRLILGMKKPSAGTISYFRNGQKTNNLSIGYLPQYSKIDRKFPISVHEVVLSGLESRATMFLRPGKKQLGMVEETLERMELQNLSHCAIGSLSGGQMQRVLLARAIVSKPEVLILDEPNTYIDKRFQGQMYKLLNEINKECAIIMVSHDITSVLENAKHVACVNRSLHYHDKNDMPKEKLEEHFMHI